jgi:hypothetical protein
VPHLGPLPPPDDRSGGRSSSNKVVFEHRGCGDAIGGRGGG